jgi:hypothetical protein
MWGVRTPSTLTVKVTGPANAGVTGDLEIITLTGETQTRRLTRGDFPLDVTISKGSSCGVMVGLDFAGEETSITVSSTVTGASSRGPDDCTLAVAEGNEHAETNVTVGAED